MDMLGRLWRKGFARNQKAIEFQSLRGITRYFYLCSTTLLSFLLIYRVHDIVLVYKKKGESHGYKDCLIHMAI
jgi:hypothetical protein